MKFHKKALISALVIAGFSAPAFAGDVSLRFAHIWAPGHPFQTCGIDKMAEMLKKADVGLSIRAYPSEQLGTMAQLADSVVSGDVDMSVFGASYLANRYEMMNLFDSAYVFESAEDASKLIESKRGAEIWQGLLEKTGIRRLGNWLYGARHITANKPVRSPADLEGVKFRVPDNSLMIENARSIGATPVPMAFGEVYLALQQGVIDAQENPLTVIETQKFTEVQDYVSLTGHMIQVSPVVVSEKTWQKLDDSQRDTLLNVVKGVTEGVNECVRSQEAALVAKWQKDASVTVIPADEIDMDAFRKKAREHISKTYGDTEWGKIYAEFVSR
ncbi:DctP family TRAP transporter solute-binding subunit [Oceanibacterium hippocampi]|uniref:2,3-diketo-L-gulonate-binding periplasmic protein YiaO n=1 Tax=Oceanibacterium hippocampi TaxID=745714 RepID=A0A1Y5U0L8_9PROT|nr:DctP family TRAP transporter solute-binding subunit [Oceanibacterium hippocampi]SLN77823.1 2,3-diketo-L-gulonate-binding periplasmic protein YiaO precursor [Oceanibacterium hippocampi]